MNHDDASWRDAELEADLAAERSLPTAPAAEREALYARVIGTVAAPTGASVSASTAAISGPKLLVLVALLAGVAWFALRAEPTPSAAVAEARPPEVTRPAVAPPAAPSPVEPPIAAMVEVKAPTVEPAPPSPAPKVAPTRRRATPRPRPAPRASTLAAEQALLEGARRALASGDPAGALTAVEHHTRRFAAGQLAEERELLRIQALVLAGERDRAQAVADRFRVRFPESLLLEALEVAVGRKNE